jgi:ribonuclease E
VIENEVIEDVEVVEELDAENLISPIHDETSQSSDAPADGRSEPAGDRGEAPGDRSGRPRRRRRRGRRGRSDRGGDAPAEPRAQSAGESAPSRPPRRGRGDDRPRGEGRSRGHDQRRDEPRDLSEEPTLPMYDESRPLADELFDADDLDRVGAAGRDDVRPAEGPWDSDRDRDSDSEDSDIWGTVDQDSDVHDVDVHDLDGRGRDSEASDRDDSDTEDSDIEDGDIEDGGNRASGDDETSRADTKGETGPDRDKRRGRRRRRRRGGRDRGAESTSSEELDDDLPAGRLDEPASLESDRRGEIDGLDDSDEDGDIDHHSHRGIPSWDDAIGFIIDANMESRSKSPKSGGPRGRRGGRGRSSAPRRGRDGERS